MTDTPVRFTLRQLPLPAKLVLTAFLLAVGLGYFSALVQLHLQHSSRQGEALPSRADVIERFSGLREADGTPPKSRIELLITGHPENPFNKTNMTPAFFAQAGKREYEQDCKARGKGVVDAERTGDRNAVLAWMRAEPAARKAAFEADKFPLPADLWDRPMTEEFLDRESRTVPIKTLLESRCGVCHANDKQPKLDTYDDFEPHVTAPLPAVIDGKWVRSNRQMTVDGLTQSTHAHLLSFAVLFTLTGLVFAFTSYPAPIRAVIAPVVLVAQVTDVACWWLARLDGVGPTFATAIIFTGGIVGTGLGLQIMLSLFNMYGRAGKLALLALFLAGGAALGAVYTQALAPALEAERQAAKG